MSKTVFISFICSWASLHRFNWFNILIWLYTEEWNCFISCVNSPIVNPRPAKTLSIPASSIRFSSFFIISSPSFLSRSVSCSSFLVFASWIYLPSIIFFNLMNISWVVWSFVYESCVKSSLFCFSLNTLILSAILLLAAMSDLLIKLDNWLKASFSISPSRLAVSSKILPVGSIISTKPNKFWLFKGILILPDSVLQRLSIFVQSSLGSPYGNTLNPFL